VALVGTSYSQDERWGFADALKVALGADVLNVAARGEGPFAPMRAYLEGETVVDVPPELVVWEIPERYLTIPLEAQAHPPAKAAATTP
jgi:alginate O-acetyltransferase complex protein AlgJ